MPQATDGAHRVWEHLVLLMDGMGEENCDLSADRKFPLTFTEVDGIELV